MTEDVRQVKQYNEPTLMKVEDFDIDVGDVNYHDVIADLRAWLGLTIDAAGFAELHKYFLEIIAETTASVNEDLLIKTVGSIREAILYMWRFSEVRYGGGSPQVKTLPVSQGDITSLEAKFASGSGTDRVIITVLAWKWPNAVLP